ncbi:MAG: U32 family peptidase C-terminal domain-containing protein [Thermodesulfovibrionales bacterium]
MNTINIPELLAPAGDFEKLVTVLHYGADAVYLGPSRFSLRNKAENFNNEELKRAVDYVHKKGKKVYVTVNIFPHNKDIGEIREYVEVIKDILPDGVIVSDLGCFDLFRKNAPNIPIHISTQANITNTLSAIFWQDLGASRLILSRELTLDEIKEIRDSVGIEIEVFVHGSICISYSGRCYISSFLAHRSANKGLCTNSCRWNYTLMEEKRPGEYMPVFEDDRGTYLMSSKDLCMIEHIDKLARAGVNSLKIEGRIKGINYAGGVVKVYREAIDSLKETDTYEVKQHWLKELKEFSNRGYTTGMFLGRQPINDYNFDTEPYQSTKDFVGVVRGNNNGDIIISLRNRIDLGDKIEFLTPQLEEQVYTVREMTDTDGNNISTARNGEVIIIKNVDNRIRENDLVRRGRRANSD